MKRVFPCSHLLLTSEKEKASTKHNRREILGRDKAQKGKTNFFSEIDAVGGGEK
jgi:hypothetical protein